MKTKILLTGAVALGALVAAVPAMAHEADATMSCTQTTFDYTAFPNAPQTANWLVTSDDQEIDSGTFSFQGGAPTLETVYYDLPAGTHTLKAYTWWTASDGNIRSIDAPPAATAVVTCGVPAPPVPPAVVTPPPPDVQPPADDTPPAAFVAAASAPVTGSAVKAKVAVVHHKPKAKKKKPHIAAAKVAKVVRKAPRLTG
jgi:hypothetical protein